MSTGETLEEVARAHGYVLVILPPRQGEESMGVLRCATGTQIDLVAYGRDREAIVSLLRERLESRIAAKDKPSPINDAAPSSPLQTPPASPPFGLPRMSPKASK